MPFHNLGGGRFEVVPPVKGTGIGDDHHRPRSCDLFNNGKIDLVINALHGPPVLLRNVIADHHDWIGLKLVGGPKSPRDAIGAAVYLTSGGVRQRRDVISGGSFASSNDPRLHFGLGASNDVEKVEIHWSDGNIQNAVISAGVDRYYTIAEGRPTVVQAP